MAVLPDPFRGGTGVIPRIKFAWIAGGAAGDHTLTGVDPNHDRLIQVWGIEFTLAEAAPPTVTHIVADLTSEFQGAALGITAADTINNAGGTSTADGWLFVVWENHDAGDFANEAYNV
jgi:hypothetical protein